jgi:outer membrane protein TolC
MIWSMHRCRRAIWSAALCAASGLATASGQDKTDGKPDVLPAPEAKGIPLESLPEPQALPGLQRQGPLVTTIDLASALRLAGVENPQILIARTRVVEATAVRQLAAAQILPSLNLGLNYDDHTGPLQQSSGNILKVNRQAMYLGAGANAVAAGTVNIPGLVYNLNLSEGIFGMLITRQGIERARYASIAVRNEMFRRVAVAYLELLRTEARRSIALQTRNEAAEVARLTSVFAKAGQVALADAERGSNELQRRNSDLAQAEAEVLIASARLAELLALDRSLRLHPVEDRLVPMPVVPEPIPLEQLLAIALMQRPELGEYQAAVRQALLALDGAKVLPFSPNMIVGFSSGTFGGGSNLVASANPGFRAAPFQPTFGNFGQRNDFDVVAYWTLQNIGVGNAALIKAARANLGVAEFEKLRVFNQVRREVADAYVLTQTRFGQISRAENAVHSGEIAFKADFRRIEGGVGLPLELLQSLSLLARARGEYLDAITDYNEAQVDLYVALGQPPADTLARPVPTDFSAPIPEAPRLKNEK